MKISILTVFPEIYDNFLQTSLILRAQEKGLVEFDVVKFSDFCAPKERIDEPVCGPGAGMILKPEIVEKAIESCEAKWGKAEKIFFSPQGKKLNQPILRGFAKKFFDLEEEKKIYTTKEDKHIMLVCSRYEGMDERVEKYYADDVISIGDYVLMGGDLPAQVFLEGILRLLPGVVGKEESTLKESFESSFLDYPEYGLPASWNGEEIPEIVRSGNHEAIDKWRENQAAKKTIQNRFDWFISHAKDEKEYHLAKKFIPNHYVALLHTQILVKGGREGDTSITSIDIHDVARSSATYDIENYFIVSRLKDQQAIMGKFLDFWKSKEGLKYNANRYQAVSRVIPAYSFEEVLDAITKKEGKKPLVVATSAQSHSSLSTIDYFAQGKLWKQERPVLFIFGTGHGLSESVLQKCDYMLLPVEGMTDFNHLSVRSAVAVVLDRWLGLKTKIYG